MANIKPLGQRVLVKRLEADAISAGGIVLPDTAKEKPQEAEVLSLGTGGKDDKGNAIEFTVKVGDKVDVGATGDGSGLNGGTSSFSALQGKVGLTVTAVNDAPVNIVPSALTTQEDIAKVITGLQIADVDAGTGAMTVTLSVAHGTISLAAGTTRQAEIADLWLALRCQKNVGGLDVTMNNALRMSIGERVADFGKNLNRPGR